VYLARLGEEAEVVKAADDLYETLTKAGVETLYDDRDARAGEKFKDADLMGIQTRVVISAKTTQNNQVEVKARTSEETQFMTSDELVKHFAGTN